MDAINVRYRHIDTAQSYGNEEEVGNAIKKSGLKREEIFLTTKVWITNYVYENCKKSIYESLHKLQMQYIDLVLLHQPFNDYYGAYRALEELYLKGVIKAIGVYNFYTDRMVDIVAFSNIKPMINLIEIHPYHQQTEVKIDIKQISSLDTNKSLFFSHTDPNMVEWFVKMAI